MSKSQFRADHCDAILRLSIYKENFLRWEPKFITEPTAIPDILTAVTTMNAAMLCTGHLATLHINTGNFLTLSHVTTLYARHPV
jgi:hypothetical protein